MKVFQPISQEPDFFQIWNLHRNIANNIDFHYRPNAENKFNNFQKPYFSPISGHFQDKFSYKKIKLCHAELHMGF